ncbi:hypothetical protein KSF_066340 [Reticulibacter mediterranei]|uniref:Uncharacterized protein n=1 Tax=Reticulibacter mediterranei TaxID=2778369 RepID=A0A8J3IUS6_9CHLR|nr:hypothetical protein [Reticulibacter mediterranei]GHO96586.1 hypothetical protein KSF_066340 [Reticulibacter mediterranei]
MSIVRHSPSLDGVLVINMLFQIYEDQLTIQDAQHIIGMRIKIADLGIILAEYLKDEPKR